MHKRFYQRVLPLVFVATLFLFNFHGVIGSNEGFPWLYSADMESKIACNASINDDFADDVVLVVLFKKTSAILDTSDASISLKTYSKSDFPEVKCLSIDDLTKHSVETLNREVNAKVNDG